MAHKYFAKSVVVDGIKFPSTKQAKRYRDLKLLERAGQIRDLELDPRYDLVVNGVKIGRYTGDFRYREEVSGWDLVVEDVKGYPSRDYILRVKLMKAIHGIEIRET